MDICPYYGSDRIFVYKNNNISNLISFYEYYILIFFFILRISRFSSLNQMNNE